MESITHRTIKLRRDTAVRWSRVDPILAEGEPGFETDSGRFKVGDGNTPWRNLPYFVPGEDGDIPGVDPTALQDHIDSPLPHPVYDDGPSLELLYQNAKV